MLGGGKGGGEIDNVASMVLGGGKGNFVLWLVRCWVEEKGTW